MSNDTIVCGKCCIWSSCQAKYSVEGCLAKKKFARVSFKLQSALTANALLVKQLAEANERIRQFEEYGCFVPDDTGHKCQLAVKNEELNKRIAELESWLKSFHETAGDAKGYKVYELNPKTESGLPMIPAESEKK